MSVAEVENYAREHGISTRQAYRRLADSRTPAYRIPQDKVDRIIELADEEVPVPMIAFDVSLRAEQVRKVLRRTNRRAEKTWREVRVTITNNPALRELHEEIMK